MPTIYQRLINLYPTSNDFYVETTTALNNQFKTPPEFLDKTKWEFLEFEKVFELFYHQFSMRFVRYQEKIVFQSFMVNNMIVNLYDLWIKTNWLNDSNIMIKLKDIQTRGTNISETNSQINSPFPLDTKYLNKDSQEYQTNEPIQSKSQSHHQMETFNVINDFDRVRGDMIKDTLNEFFESFNKLFIEYYGLQIL